LLSVTVGEHLVEDQVKVFVQVQGLKRRRVGPEERPQLFRQPDTTAREPLRGRSREAVPAPIGARVPGRPYGRQRVPHDDQEAQPHDRCPWQTIMGREKQSAMLRAL